MANNECASDNKVIDLVVTPENFLNVYYTTLASYYNLRYSDDLNLLIKMSELADEQTGRVLIPVTVRQNLCESLAIHTTNLSKSLKRLRDKNLIFGERGEFVINKDVFWHGNRQEILSGNGVSFTINFKNA